eukprot:scaffold647915_cov45-Prasinocladus_malaysianus.AAC.2
MLSKTSSSVLGAGCKCTVRGTLVSVFFRASLSAQAACMRSHPVFWVKAWVNDAIHVKVEVVKLYPLRIRLGCVHGNIDAIDFLGMLLNHSPTWCLERPRPLGAV